MLADQLNSEGLNAACGFAPERVQPVLTRIAQAQKYVLAPQFAAVADALSADFGSLVRAFPFCRLPYPEVWFEVVHTDRPEFAASPIQAPMFQVKPVRVGYLCTATRPDLSAWRAHLFWNIDSRTFPDGGGCNASMMAIDYDMTAPLTHEQELPDEDERVAGMRRDIFGDIPAHPGWRKAATSVKLALMNHTNPVIADFDIPRFGDLSLTSTDEREVYEILGQLSRSDWAGEATFVLAMIGLLNARNAVETMEVDQTRLNRARRKRGELPLFEHKVLKIHSRQQRRVAGHRTADGAHAAMRGHFVSGHWKVRRTGIFFWKPFARGDFKRGTIEKQYELD